MNRQSRIILNRFAGGLVALLFFSSAVLLPPRPARAQGGVTCTRDVLVRSGETLSTIAARELGSVSAYPQIVTATNAAAAIDANYATIADPGRISVGWRLCIPNSLVSMRCLMEV